jgi:ABC-type lipoprotein release transport system permease subunit
MTLFFLLSSIRNELVLSVQSLPDITLTQLKAGRESFVDEKEVDTILEIVGVSSAYAYIEAPYVFKEGVVFDVLGVDVFEDNSDTFINNLLQKYTLEEGNMLVSDTVLKTVVQAYYTESFNFIQADGKLKEMKIAASFSTLSIPRYRWLVIMNKKDAREIFNIDQNEATAIAVNVANKDEVALVAQKIQRLYPNSKLMTKKQKNLEYEQLFNFRAGLYVTLFSIALLTFFIIVYDRLSGVSSEEKREIGILKALGWQIEDVLNAKFYEAFFIAVFAYILGVVLAYIYVFYAKAPFFANIFLSDLLLQAEAFKLTPHIDFFYLFLVFLLVVPFYFAAVIIPSWRVATMDADEVMR